MNVDRMRIVSDQGVRVIGAADRLPDVSSGDMVRQAAIARGTVDAEKIWMGWVELGPALVSAVHHHGEAESGIFIVSGHARFYSGADLAASFEATEGDFIWVPPNVIHVEQNVSSTAPVRMVVARSTQETLVFNLPTPAGWTPMR
ncbi:MAG TPA: cupin domain-containing protein [Chloroflexota bacterium]|nr:cupin domain-containing protein [Chloroflexota bacterium]